MTEDPPRLLAVSALSFVGAQVVLLGLLMLSLGLVLGIEMVLQPAVATQAAATPLGAAPDLPGYVQDVTAIRNGAVATAAVALTGLLWLDWQA